MEAVAAWVRAPCCRHAFFQTISWSCSIPLHSVLPFHRCGSRGQEKLECSGAAAASKAIFPVMTCDAPVSSKVCMPSRLQSGSQNASAALSCRRIVQEAAHLAPEQ